MMKNIIKNISHLRQLTSSIATVSKNFHVMGRIANVSNILQPVSLPTWLSLWENLETNGHLLESIHLPEYRFFNRFKSNSD